MTLITEILQTLLDKVEADQDDEAASEIAKLLFDTSALRSGYSLREPVDFAERILNIMYANLDIDPETPVSRIFFFAFYRIEKEHFLNTQSTFENAPTSLTLLNDANKKPY